jgi:hypothetical protein
MSKEMSGIRKRLNERKNLRVGNKSRKAAEYVSCLSKLHKLQGVLLAELGKVV